QGAFDPFTAGDQHVPSDPTLFASGIVDFGGYTYPSDGVSLLVLSPEGLLLAEGQVATGDPNSFTLEVSPDLVMAWRARGFDVVQFALRAPNVATRTLVSVEGADVQLWWPVDAAPFGDLTLSISADLAVPVQSGFERWSDLLG